jgi:hypothetical protein
MNIVGLSDALDTVGVPYEGGDFEQMYSSIASNPKHKELTSFVECRVSEYFSTLKLPDIPTIYDYLVLSLRPKDGIATFNWDPFLWQACQRNHLKAPLPKLFFLHGCAVVGYCEKDKEQGLIGHSCKKCGQLYKPTRLLYPVEQKDYTSDPYISSQWVSIRAVLGSAFLLTLFGYGAPKSDMAAVELMSKAWGAPEDRPMEEIEIIDIKSDQELAGRWARFIHTHHYSVCSDYFTSILANYPRRSVEAYWQSLVEARFPEENPVPKCESLDELGEWFEPLIKYERQ